MFEVGVGYWISVSIITFVYIIIGIASVNLYDKYGDDCLMIEYLKEFQFKNNQVAKKSRIVSFITKWSKRSRFLLDLLLSLKNTGLMVIYRRDGFRLYNGFTGKGIKLYFLINSLLVSILWNSAIYTGFSIWKSIKGIF